MAGKSLCSITSLLLLAVSDGNPLMAALAAAVAAGVMTGSHEELWTPVAVAAAAAAGAKHSDLAGGQQQQQHHRPVARRGQQQQQQQQQQKALAGEAAWAGLDLSPAWQYELQEQVLALLHALSVACEQQQQQQQVVAAGSGAVSALSRQLLGCAYSRALITHGDSLQQLVQQHSSMQAAWPGHLQQQQQQMLQVPSLSGLVCSLEYIQQQGCGIAGVLHHAGCCWDAAAANSWLQKQQQQHSPHEVGSAVRWLAAASVQLPKQQQLSLLTTLRAVAAALGSSYSCYLQLAAPEVVAQVDAAAARQQWDRVFALHVAVLAAIQQQQQQEAHPTAGTALEAAAIGSKTAACQAGSDNTALVKAADEPVAAEPASASATWQQCHRGAAAAQALATLAELQFCRVQVPGYVDLLRDLVVTLAGSAAAADAFLVAALPCYDAMTQPLLGPSRTATVAAAAAAGCRGSSSEDCQQQQISNASEGMQTTDDENQVTAANSSSHQTLIPAGDPWLADSVTVAKLSFLLPLIPVACRASTDIAEAAKAVLPLLLLLLPHPIEQTARAAHSAFAALFFSAADDASKDAAVAAGAGGSQQQQQQQALEKVLVQAVPLYLRRSLRWLPESGSVEGFGFGFTCLLRHLPTGHASLTLAVEQVAQKMLQLEEQQQLQQQQQQPPPLGAAARNAGSSSSIPGQRLPAAGSKKSKDRLNDDEQQLVSNAAGAAADQLFELLQLAVQLVDYQLLPTVLVQVAGAVTAAPSASVREQWLAGLYQSCLGVGDYTRKFAVMQWFDELNSRLHQVPVRHPQQQPLIAEQTGVDGEVAAHEERSSSAQEGLDVTEEVGGAASGRRIDD
jgi:hypothetical protein